jgi:hypothetical protein
VASVPFSISNTMNANKEFEAARDRDERKQNALDSFNAKYKAKVEKRNKRAQRKFQRELDR